MGPARMEEDKEMDHRPLPLRALNPAEPLDLQVMKVKGNTASLTISHEFDVAIES